MNLTDLIIVVLVVWGAWTGCRKGLLVTLSRFFGYVFGIAAGVILYKPFANFLSTGLGLEKVFSRLGSVLINTPPNLKNLPINNLSISKVQQATANLNIPGEYQKYLHEIINQLDLAAKRSDVTTIGGALNHMAGGLLLQLVAFLILMFVVERAIAKATTILSKAIHYTPVGMVDQGGGLLLGAGKSFLLIAITLLVINPLLSIGLLNKGPAGAFCKQISSSQINDYVVAKFE